MILSLNIVLPLDHSFLQTHVGRFITLKNGWCYIRFSREIVDCVLPSTVGID